MYRNREILQKTADDLISTAENLHRQITKTIASLSQSDEDLYGQVKQTKTNLSTLEEFLGHQTSRAKKAMPSTYVKVRQHRYTSPKTGTLTKPVYVYR